MTPETDNSIPIDNFTAKAAARVSKDPEIVKDYLKKLVEIITAELVVNDKILIYQFGVFKKKWVAERLGVDPNNGQKITIPGHYRVSFTVAKALDEAVNEEDIIMENSYEKDNELSSLSGALPDISESELFEETTVDQFDQRNITGNDLEEKSSEAETGTEINNDENSTKLTKDILVEDDSEFFKTTPRASLEEEFEKLTKPKRAKKDRKFKTVFWSIALLLLLLISAIFWTVLQVKEASRIDSVVNRLNAIVDPETYQINYTLLDQFHREKTAVANRDIISRHLIKRGDTIYDLAIKYWNNKNLWPDMYVMNLNKITDPDMLKYGFYLNIYDKLAEDTRDLSLREKNELVERYLLSYKLYKALGYRDIENKQYRKGYKRLNDSVWILYTAAGYDQKLLKKYNKAIDNRDEEILNRFIEIFGYR